MAQTDLIGRDAAGLLADLRRGAVRAEAVMDACLERIAAVNPQVNAIVSLRDADALMAAARDADAVPEAARGPLHGLPMAVKDLAEVAGLPTSWGSPVHARHVSRRDTPFVARLRAAGAIFIGKTNTPEFGLGSHSYNAVHGTTRNPYDPARSAGGSSGGAAVGLAARMLWLADGSDMMGSLRNPAAWNNVFGFRPTHGVVPGDPEGELFLHPLSTDGPMARSVADLALLLDVMAGDDPRVPSARPGHPQVRAALDRPPAPCRIGWIGDWGGYYPLEDGVAEACAPGLQALAAQGHRVEEVIPPFDPADLWQSWCDLRAFAVASRHGPLLDDPATRALLKPELAWEIARGRALDGAAIARAGAIRSDWFRATLRMFADFDVLALPAAQCFAFPAEWTWPRAVGGRDMDTYHRWMEVVVPASLIGLPALAVPSGFGPTGLPMGLQLLAPRGGDAALLALGHACDRASRLPERHPPPV